MSRVVRDSEGKPLYEVEVADAFDSSSASPLRGVSEAIEGVTDGLTDVGEAIASASEDILNSMQQRLGALAPDEVELEFGVALKGSVGVPLITKASGEATFTVRVCWRPGDAR